MLRDASSTWEADVERGTNRLVLYLYQWARCGFDEAGARPRPSSGEMTEAQCAGKGLVRLLALQQQRAREAGGEICMSCLSVRDGE